MTDIEHRAIAGGPLIPVWIAGGENASHPVSVTVVNAAGIPTTVTLQTVTLTVADTEYQLVLPANCRGFELQCRTAFDVRFAFATGYVAGATNPYETLKSGTFYWSFPYQGGVTGFVVYLASAQAGVVVESIAWSA